MKNNPLKSPKQSLFYRIYQTAEYYRKTFERRLDNLFTSSTEIFGNAGGRLAKAVSLCLSWVLHPKNSSARVAPWNAFKALLGLPVVVATFALALIGILVTGTVASIFGLRNLGEYPIREQLAAWLILFLAIFCAPLVFSQYALFKIALVLAYSVSVIGFDFLYGQCGILSLGTSGFLLLGGYATLWLTNGGLNPELAILASSLLLGILGALLSIPSFRIKDFYLVVITMAFAIAVPKVMKSQYLVNYSGLRQGGLALKNALPLGFLPSMPLGIQAYFAVVLPALVLFYFAYNLMHHSQIGRAFKTIKCDNEVSMIMGIPVIRYKVLAFVMSAIYAGFSGGFLIMLTRFITTDSYTIHNSIDVLVANVLGGPGTLLGAALGGAFLAFEQDFTRLMSGFFWHGKDLAHATHGLLLILVIIFAPRGIAGELAGWMRSRFSPRVRRGSFQAVPPPDYDYLEEMKKSLNQEFRRD